MRADRLLAILLLLQQRGKMTAGELAARFEVSVRTIYRDLDALSATGVPIVAESGPGGGCWLAEDYRAGLTGLTPREVEAVSLAAAYSPLAELELDAALPLALLKLSAGRLRAQAGHDGMMRARLHVDPSGWFQQLEPVRCLHALRDAVWNEERIRITHAKGSEAQRVRVVEPYGLVIKANAWYLVAGTEDGLRVFRAARITRVEPTGERFSRPEDFDLPSFWTRWCATFAQELGRYAVRISLPTALVSELAWCTRTTSASLLARAIPERRGRVVVDANFSSLDEARAFLLRHGPDALALAPDELCRAVRQRAGLILAVYETTAPTAFAGVEGVRAGIVPHVE
jgi:predicted DNA-binding transcriptional regulator YafY